MSVNHQRLPGDDPAAVSLELEVAESVIGRVVVIEAAGEIDRTSSPTLSDALRRATVEHTEPVLVDLCSVSFIDSSVISLLLNALRRLRHEGRELSIACAPSNVLRVLELTGLLQLFSIFATRRDALTAMSRATTSDRLSSGPRPR